MSDFNGATLLVLEDDSVSTTSKQYIENLLEQGKINSASLALARLSNELDSNDFVALRDKINNIPVKKRRGIFPPTSSGKSVGHHGHPHGNGHW
ncbi:hypothetical protein COX93_01135 [Candidatus Nomurabacteria bacterium CG_4_10_14_0_2_um_filter_30_12]|uniref:Uncharacterized protein n=3 Tax=Candidatus Nomuraibacteriota TaxID=1752729 RepID=A0A1J4UYY4_9BACT|nr:MAG: hypothetical protein AUJ22_00155 [Candidatus Nomurabacteria bacterium CG1_02_31_12]PIR68823.1 MAG: hypothetical protein COU48_01955 [Candidatus Nomurabacteria bacterium CG10_big_fil_rev_8_21_14_0_10_03_31_7]PIZ87438.1 MAG: hypothetical protein COX93_01135 [Candidatus Nomurabacteria bacterium CG_4_10_14_0_2_um_filter_30_12]